MYFKCLNVQRHSLQKMVGEKKIVLTIRSKGSLDLAELDNSKIFIKEYRYRMWKFSQPD